VSFVWCVFFSYFRVKIVHDVGYFDVIHELVGGVSMFAIFYETFSSIGIAV
jgi:hypothetical protein